ncbi:hypothetical protein CPA45_01005 [Vreelandella nigrificans]|uniref:Uncharacterized protein n=1 Tax=Vreelandella nigrificans TaxID=2042704 RepID=A0A2A4HTF5_9GAMM|nr:hypothetical protein CPA45_01005 [Halomonas nigrificans]
MTFLRVSVAVQLFSIMLNSERVTIFRYWRLSLLTGVATGNVDVYVNLYSYPNLRNRLPPTTFGVDTVA